MSTPFQFYKIRLRLDAVRRNENNDRQFQFYKIRLRLLYQFSLMHIF